MGDKWSVAWLAKPRWLDSPSHEPQCHLVSTAGDLMLHIPKHCKLSSIVHGTCGTVPGMTKGIWTPTLQHISAQNCDIHTKTMIFAQTRFCVLLFFVLNCKEKLKLLVRVSETARSSVIAVLYFLQYRVFNETNRLRREY